MIKSPTNKNFSSFQKKSGERQGHTPSASPLTLTSVLIPSLVMCSLKDGCWVTAGFRKYSSFLKTQLKNSDSLILEKYRILRPCNLWPLVIDLWDNQEQATRLHALNCWPDSFLSLFRLPASFLNVSHKRSSLHPAYTQVAIIPSISNNRAKHSWTTLKMVSKLTMGWPHVYTSDRMVVPNWVSGHQVSEYPWRVMLGRKFFLTFRW